MKTPPPNPAHLTAAKNLFANGADFLAAVAPNADPAPQAAVPLDEEQAYALVQMLVESAAEDDARLRQPLEDERRLASQKSRGLDLDWEQLLEAAGSAKEWLGYAAGGLGWYLKARKKQGKLDKWLENPWFCAAYEQLTGEKCEED